MKFLVVLAVLTLAAVQCQPTDDDDVECRHRRRCPCRSPPVFESNLQEFITKQKIFVSSRFSYDGFLKRERVVEAIITPKKRSYFDVIYYHKYAIMYVLNLKTRNCTRYKIDRPWKPMGLPRHSKYLGSAYLGTAAFPLAGVETQTWVTNLTKSDLDPLASGPSNNTGNGTVGFLTSTFTSIGCLPLAQSFFSKKYGFIQANYFDITLGIANPMVFNPHPECYRQGQVLPGMGDGERHEPWMDKSHNEVFERDSVDKL